MKDFNEQIIKSDGNLLQSKTWPKYQQPLPDNELTNKVVRARGDFHLLLRDLDIAIHRDVHLLTVDKQLKVVP